VTPERKAARRAVLRLVAADLFAIEHERAALDVRVTPGGLLVDRVDEVLWRVLTAEAVQLLREAYGAASTLTGVPMTELVSRALLALSFDEGAS
jgi:hypothetical protein